MTSKTGSIRWAELSREGHAILRVIGVPIWQGYSPFEISRALTISQSCVLLLLELLAEEIERLAQD
jgi:hypothetical protein